MRTLITGGGGFVGQHLLRELQRRGNAVVAATQDGAPPERGALTAEERRRVRWITLDVTREEELRRAVEETRPEWVFHLAGQSSVSRSFREPLATWEVNATGTLRLLEVLEQAKLPEVRVLVVSSAEVYGEVPEAEQPIAETRPLAPATPYGASKAAAEMAALQANARGRVRVVIARSFNHIGPGQEEHFALPSFAYQLVRTRVTDGEPVLRVGNLAVRRDLLDVRDVVQAYLRLISEGRAGEVYNVCSGEAHELRALVEELAALSGTGARLEVDPARFRPVDLPLLVGDPARLRALGWAPQIPLRDTLREMLQAAAGELQGK